METVAGTVRRLLHTLEEELVAIASEELGALGSDGGDGMHDAGQQAQDERKQHVYCRNRGACSSIERAVISNNLQVGSVSKMEREVLESGMMCESRQEVTLPPLAAHRLERAKEHNSSNASAFLSTAQARAEFHRAYGPLQRANAFLGRIQGLRTIPVCVHLSTLKA